MALYCRPVVLVFVAVLILAIVNDVAAKIVSRPGKERKYKTMKKRDVCAEPELSNKYCKKDFAGKDYSGTLAKTKNGKDCQAWNTNTPHTTSAAAKFGANYPEGNVDDANNYCRNPDGDNGGPWCYTTNIGTRWEYCDIALCPAIESDAANRIHPPCQKWDSDSTYPYRVCVDNHHMRYHPIR
eukprot:GHVU01169022.1.p1 GENE.GHVU01169022.1~~GHVU01169022.1.p1  ORF type:complete len:183 (-),score=20.57 GHVU01169022.1:193-741(-)